ncbi:MAG: restriction endonuclease [Spirochaetia bacterium]|jgi:restriction system protein
MAKAIPKSHMSFTDAAERVLEDEGKALKYTEIASKAIQRRYLQTESKTPWISMHVLLRSEIKRRETRGEPQRFIFLGQGIFGLVGLLTGTSGKKTRSATDQVRDSRGEATQELYKRLTTGNHGDNFEAMVADILIAMGYQNVEVIGGKDDQGVDILCEKRDGIMLTRVAVQCKCRSVKNEVGPKDVSTLRDNLSSYQCQQGILVTTSRLNDTAKAKAKEPGKEPIHFIEHDEILDLFAEYGVGIRMENLKFFQLDESQYDFLKA